MKGRSDDRWIIRLSKPGEITYWFVRRERSGTSFWSCRYEEAKEFRSRFAAERMLPEDDPTCEVVRA